MSGALGVALLLQAGTAEAGRVRFSGRAHVTARWHGGASVRFHRPIRFARPAWRPRVWVGGSVWVGSYYYPRPYYYYYYPESAPQYYGNSYYPVQPAPQIAAPGSVPVVAAAPARPSLATFGIGVFAGGSSVEERVDSSDLGAMLRLRLSGGLLLEGEIARTEVEGAVNADRRIGGSLVYEIGARNAFAPFLLAGGGVQQTNFGDDNFSTTQQYGEVGVGLRWALSRNLHLIGDIRAGRSEAVVDDRVVVGTPDTPEARAVVPPSGLRRDDTEDFTRGRIAAVLYF